MPELTLEERGVADWAKTRGDGNGYQVEVTAHTQNFF